MGSTSPAREKRPVGLAHTGKTSGPPAHTGKMSVSTRPHGKNVRFSPPTWEKCAGPPPPKREKRPVSIAHTGNTSGWPCRHGNKGPVLPAHTGKMSGPPRSRGKKRPVLPAYTGKRSVRLAHAGKTSGPPRPNGKKRPVRLAHTGNNVRVGRADMGKTSGPPRPHRKNVRFYPPTREKRPVLPAYTGKTFGSRLAHT